MPPARHRPRRHVPLTLVSGDALILKRGWASRSSDRWSNDDYDVLSGSEVVGRIFVANDSAPDGKPWFWGLAFGHLEGRSPKHGFESTREAAMAAFAKSWRRV